MNETVEELAGRAWTAAWVKAWAEMPDIGQGRIASIPTKAGGNYSYTYAALSDILGTVRKALTDNGLAVSQSVVEAPSGFVGVETRIYHQAGHVEVFGPIVLPAAGDARSVGSAVTYARRYSLLAALGVAPDEDTDAAPEKAASKPRAAAKKPDKPAEAAAPERDRHGEMWNYAVERIGATDAELVFLDGLAAAKVKMIRTDDQAAIVKAHIDGIADGK